MRTRSRATAVSDLLHIVRRSRERGCFAAVPGLESFANDADDRQTPCFGFGLASRSD